MKYTWESSPDCEIWMSDIFGTVEECMKDAVENHGYRKGKEIAVAEAVSVTLDDIHFSLDRILEDISENFYDEYGEIAESYCDELDYLYTRNNDAYKVIEMAVKDTLKEQLKKYDLVPHFFKTRNIKMVKI